MAQFLFGLLAGIVVGLVMEWVIDWAGLLPKKPVRDGSTQKSGQKVGGTGAKRTDVDSQAQSATVASSSNPETSGE